MRAVKKITRGHIAAECRMNASTMILPYLSETAYRYRLFKWSYLVLPQQSKMYPESEPY